MIETPDIEVDEIHPKMLDIKDQPFNVKSSIAILESIPGVDLGQEAESKEVSFEEDTPIKQEQTTIGTIEEVKEMTEDEKFEFELSK